MQYHRVYAVDMVGSRQSNKPSAICSLTYQAQLSKNFIDALSMDATFIGNLMGSSATLQFALIPKKVEKLVLADSLGLGKEIAIALRLMTLPFVG